MRTLILIDGQYLWNVKQKTGNNSIDYFKLKRKLEFGVTTAILFSSDPPVQSSALKRHNAFIKAISNIDDFIVIRSVVKTENISCPHCGQAIISYRQGRTDVQIAVTAVSAMLAGKVDRLVLVAGDSDFIPILELASRIGVQTILVADPDDIISELKEAAHRFKDLTKVLSSLSGGNDDASNN